MTFYIVYLVVLPFKNFKMFISKTNKLKLYIDWNLIYQSLFEKVWINSKLKKIILPLILNKWLFDLFKYFNLSNNKTTCIFFLIYLGLLLEIF